MIKTESYNCYEYFKNNTAAFGDYDPQYISVTG